MVSNSIGRSRSSRIYRLLGGVYLVTIGATVVIPVLTILAAIFFLIDMIVGLIADRPAQRGRTLGTAPLHHHLLLFKWVLWGEPFPGFIPSGEHAGNASV